MRFIYRPRSLAAAVATTLAACFTPPLTQPSADASTAAADGGAWDGGGWDGGSSSWQWLPIAGSQCASGSTAGFALQPSSLTDELFIFVQGGGACWNAGTCVPSLIQFGPACDYGQVCLLDAQGGTQPTAAFVTHPDPYPADAGGALPNDLATLNRSRALDRSLPDNPFRVASFIYVPYCTGDLHAGSGQHTWQYKYNLFDQPSSYTVHFAGATNMALYIERIKALYPNVRRIWLTGASAGGYGATLNFDRFARAFPQADVNLLADSSPLVPSVHWAEWLSVWNLQLPEGCSDCDAGLPETMRHLLSTWPNRRLGLLAYDADKVISWFFFAPPGAANLLNPPTATYAARLSELESDYDSHPNAHYFVAPGGDHVLWPGYGTRLDDGGYSASLRSRDGGASVRDFIDGWAEGSAGYRSSR